MTRRKASSASDRVLFDWSAEALAKARALWDSGLSAKKIGDAIGTSKNSLVGKAHRLHWPSRPSPIKEAGAPRQRKPHVIGNAQTLAPLRTLACVMNASTPDPIVLDRRRTCAWINGQPDRHARYCDAPVQRGSSYCPAHHARCWITPTPRQSNPEIGPVPMRDGRADDRRQAFPP